jgi:hypothetical protein
VKEMTPEEIRLRKVIRETEAAIEATRRLHRVQALANEARAMADERRFLELEESVVVLSALTEYSQSVLVGAGIFSPGGEGVILCGVQQSRGASKFLASEAASEDGWTWPVQVMKSGWAAGTLEAASGKLATPHYFPPEVVAQVAQAVNGVRFRRKHPDSGDGSDAPELTIGWMSNGRMAGSAALAKVNLLKSATDIRSMLLAAQEAGKLDLFSVSIFAYFGFKGTKIDGKPALLATSLQRFVGLDMCAEPGAGGRFLPVAASGNGADDQQKIIAKALIDSYDKDSDPEGRGPLSVVKTYPDYVIASAADGKLYFIRYTVGDAGIIFQSAQETEGEHIPIRV